MFNKEQTNNNLECILENQKEILKVLKSIDNNIVKYFGEEHELKEKELVQKILNAHFNRKQLDVLQESINYTKEKYSCNSIKNDKTCKHHWIYSSEETGERSPTGEKYFLFRRVCAKCGYGEDKIRTCSEIHSEALDNMNTPYKKCLYETSGDVCIWND